MTEQEFIDQGYILINGAISLNTDEAIIIVTDPLTNVTRHLMFQKQNGEWVFDDFSIRA